MYNKTYKWQQQRKKKRHLKKLLKKQLIDLDATVKNDQVNLNRAKIIKNRIEDKENEKIRIKISNKRRN